MLTARLFVFLSVTMVVQADTLLLRSQSFNTVSQEEITGEDLYNVSTVVKGNSQLDFSLNIQKINITTLIDNRGDAFKDLEQQFFLRSFFTGNGEQVRLSGLVVSEVFHVKDYFARSTENMTLFSLEVLSSSVKQQIGCDLDGHSCHVVYLLQKNLGQRDGFLFQIEVTTPTNISHHLAFISMQYHLGSMIDISPLAVSSIDTLVHHNSGKSCRKIHVRVLTIERRLTATGNETELFFIRYCGMERFNDPNHSVNEIVPAAWVIFEGTGQSDLKHYGVRRLYRTSGHEIFSYSIIKVFFSYPFVILANRDRIVSVDSKVFAEFLRFEGKVDEEPKFDVLYSTRINDLFCNFINLNELCCLFVLEHKESLQKYQIVEFVSVKDAIMTIDIPVNLMTMGSLQDALNTKNYLLLKLVDQLHICKKRERNLQAPVEVGSPLVNYKGCLKIDLPKDTVVKKMRELLLEENYSNCIDGYLLLALAHPTTGAQIRPMLITCPYFTLKLDTKVDNSVCDRYLTHCDSTEMTLVNEEMHSSDSVEMQSKIYVVDENFNSILPTSKGRHLTVSNNQELTISLSDYYVGDATNIEVNLAHSIISANTETFVMPHMKNDFFATFPDYFVYQFDNFLTSHYMSSSTYASYNWALIQINADMTFMLAVSSFLDVRPFNIFHVPMITKTSPNIDLSPINTIIKDPAASHQYIGHLLKVNYLFAKNNNEKDSMYFMYVDVSKKKDTIFIEMKKYREKNVPTSDLDSTFEIKMQPGEEYLYFRNPLEDHGDLSGIITTRAVYLLQVIFEEKTKFIIRMEISFDMFGPRGNSQVFDVRDVLLCNNIMLLDLRVLRGDKKESRIYIYNVDLNRKYFYNYGYIILDQTAMTLGYALHYSKEFDKGILVYFATKTIVEYSLDNTFLDINKIGNEIKEDTRKTINHYGVKIVNRFIPDKNTGGLEGSERTLKIPFRNHYMLILEVTDPTETQNKSTCLLLLGKISNMVLSTFKSYEILHDPEAEFIIPQVVAEIKIDMMPLLYRPKGSTTIKLVFFYLEQSIELNYKNIFSRPADETLDSLDLNIQFEDINGITNTDTFSIPRDTKFKIKRDPPKVISFDQEVFVNLEDYGLVSNMALQCGNASNQIQERISRNRSRVLLCPEEHFNVTLLPSISKDCAIDPNTMKWKEIKDLIKLEDSPVDGIFAVLEKEQILFFSSNDSFLRLLCRIDGKRKINEFSPSSCLMFKSFKYLEGSWVVSLFCLPGEGLVGPKLIRVTIQKQSVDTAISDTFIDLLLYDHNIQSYQVPQSLWKSIQKDSNSIKFLGSLLFIKTDVTLFSIGSKRVIDVYLENEEEGKPRLVLSNSTLQDKYSHFQIEDFAVTSLELVQSGKKGYKIVQLLIDEYTREIKLAHAFVKYEDSGSTAYKPVSNLNISAFEGMSDCKPIHGEILAGKMIPINETEWDQLYAVYLVCEDYIHEILLKEKNVLKTSIRQLQLFSQIRRYNYGGLCESRSSYKFESSDDYLLLNCVPLNSLSPHQFIIGYPLKIVSAGESNEVVNPAFTLPQFLGYTDKNSKQKLYKGADGHTRIIKTSPRSLVEQYTIHGKSRLSFDIDSAMITNPQMHLLLSNNYEAVDLPIDLSRAFLGSLKYRVHQTLRSSLDLLLVCGVYAFCLLMLYNVQTLFYLTPDRGGFRHILDNVAPNSQFVDFRSAGGVKQKFDHDLSTKLLITDVFG